MLAFVLLVGLAALAKARPSRPRQDDPSCNTGCGEAASAALPASTGCTTEQCYCSNQLYLYTFFSCVQQSCDSSDAAETVAFYQQGVSLNIAQASIYETSLSYSTSALPTTSNTPASAAGTTTTSPSLSATDLASATSSSPSSNAAAGDAASTSSPTPGVAVAASTSNIGPIVGSVVGGIAVVAVMGVLVWWLLRRNKARQNGLSLSPAACLDGEKPAPYQPTATPALSTPSPYASTTTPPMRLYDPNDPSTYPTADFDLRQSAYASSTMSDPSFSSASGTIAAPVQYASLNTLSAIPSHVRGQSWPIGSLPNAVVRAQGSSPQLRQPSSVLPEPQDASSVRAEVGSPPPPDYEASVMSGNTASGSGPGHARSFSEPEKMVYGAGEARA